MTSPFDDLAAGAPQTHAQGEPTSEPVAGTDADDAPRLRGEGAGSEANIAQVFVDERLADRYVWSRGLDWMHFDRGRWMSCTQHAVVETARKFVIGKVKRAAGRLEQGHDARTEMDTWRQYLSNAKLASVVNLTKGIVEVNAEDFDRHPDLLNTPAGVVDLRTGELRPHDPTLLLTKITSVAFRPDAEHPDWKMALGAVPDELHDWLQLRMGQAITGHMTPTDDVVFCDGGGENGKTTIFVGIRRATGDYFTVLPHKVLLPPRDGVHGEEMMVLRGARIAVMEELPEGGQLSPVQLKQLAGTPTITARPLYRPQMTWEISHTAFVTTNYLPVVNATDWGTWRRLTVLPLPYTFVRSAGEVRSELDRPCDPTLRDRVKNDSTVHEAILAWLIRGAVRWYAEGRSAPTRPAAVEAATQAWREKTDLLLAFFNERIVWDTRYHVHSTDLTIAFNQWLGHREQHVWSEKTIGQRLMSHSEFRKHRIEKRNSSPGTDLSRPEFLVNLEPPPSGRYQRYVGLRFRRNDDEVG